MLKDGMIIKRLVYTLLILLVCNFNVCKAQAISSKEAFNKTYKALGTELNQALNEKNYAKAEQLNKVIISNYESLPDSLRKEIWFNYGGQYYNVACYESLQNKKKEALKHFELAYKNGYVSYKHILEDTDLDNIRKSREFKKILAKIREEGDYLYILQKSSSYAQNERTDTLPQFTYMDANDSNLIRVREYFKLDSVAGKGDEISKIKNILTYIHNKIRHDGQHENPKGRNAIALAEPCKDGSRGLNCRGLAIVLNECYLSMGFKSRFITCLPKKYINDCHVINAVYSKTLNKWIWIDPTNNAWVMDEKGNLLSIQEVREHLRKGLPLVLNKEANWNNKEQTTKEDYLDNYMAKNLYYLSCTLSSEFGAEDRPFRANYYTALMPTGYNNDVEKGSYIVNDDNWFWQTPN
jgi:Transglutaminase-like superfamily.